MTSEALLNLNVISAALSALAALVAVLVGALSIREVRRIDLRAAIREVNERDDAMQARLDPLYPGLHSVLGRPEDQTPPGIRDVLLPFFVLFSDVFAADRDHLLGNVDNRAFLDEFAFWAQRPGCRSAWVALREQSWPTGFVTYVDNALLMPSPYPTIQLGRPEIEWPISVHQGGNLEQAAEVLLRLRKIDAELPPNSIDAALSEPIDTFGGRQSRLSAYREWLASEPVLRRWVACMGRRVVGHVQVTEPHDYLRRYLLSAIGARDPASMLELGRLFVDPDLQGRGIARDLLKPACQFIVEQERSPILAVLEGSARAISLYESSGWYIDGDFDGVQGRNLVMMRSEEK
jgi:GNAT superfamily N-acetyltransferase